MDPDRLREMVAALQSLDTPSEDWHKVKDDLGLITPEALTLLADAMEALQELRGGCLCGGCEWCQFFARWEKLGE